MILFKTTMKRCLKRPIVLITLLILPIVCLLIDFPFMGSNNAKALNNYTLAICDSDHSAASSILIQKLSQQYNIEGTDTNQINTLLTNKSCDWAIVIPKGFENNLFNGENNLLKSYGFAQQEKWQPVKLNIENIVSSMKTIGGTGSINEFNQNLKTLSAADKPLSITFLERITGSKSPGTGLMLYAMIILLGAFLLSRMFVEDKETEMTSRIATTPVKPWRYLLENLACFSIILIVQNILVLIAYVLINPAAIVNPFLILLTFIAYSIVSVGLMLTISTISKSSFMMMCASTIAVMLFSVLGGLFLPLSLMPNTIKRIAMITPTYWFSSAMISIYSGSTQFAFQLIMLVGFALVFFLVGSWKKYSKLD
jgi:ABC-2 type transport system permease protein